MTIININEIVYEPAVECVKMLRILHRQHHIPARIINSQADCSTLVEMINDRVLSVCCYNDFEMHFIAQCAQVVTFVQSHSNGNLQYSLDFWQKRDDFRLDYTFCTVIEEMLLVTLDFLDDAIDCGTSELEWQHQLMIDIDELHAMLEAITK